MSTAAVADGVRLLLTHDQHHWLWEQHHGDRDHSQDHEDSDRTDAKHRSIVWLPHTHGNHRIDDAWRIGHRRDPLVEDHVVHEAEKAQHEDHHRTALAEEIDKVLLIDGIGKSKEKANKHLRHSENDGDLHLQGVHEDELVGRAVPRWVDAKRVWARAARVCDVVHGLESHSTTLRVSAVHPPRAEQIQTDGEEVVVDETDVDRKEAHHGDD